MKNVISFVGLERCDLAYHLARHLAKIDKRAKVLMIDNSITKDLFRSLTQANPDVEYAIYESITVLKDKKYNKDACCNFDYCIIYHGMNPEVDTLKESTVTYLSTDYSTTCIEAVKSLNLPEMKNLVMVYRDKCTKKISEKFIEESLGLKVSVDNRIILDIDLKDSALYISFLHNGTQKLMDESPSFMDAIIFMCIHATGVPYKQVKSKIEK